MRIEAFSTGQGTTAASSDAQSCCVAALWSRGLIAIRQILAGQHSVVAIERAAGDALVPGYFGQRFIAGQVVYSAKEVVAIAAHFLRLPFHFLDHSGTCFIRQR